MEQDAETFLFQLFTTGAGSGVSAEDFGRYDVAHWVQYPFIFTYSEYQRLHEQYSQSVTPSAVTELRAWQQKHQPRLAPEAPLAAFSSTLDAQTRSKISSLLLDLSVCRRGCPMSR
jgi:hypothetical protein